jgi:hypothetical protein
MSQLKQTTISFKDKTLSLNRNGKTFIQEENDEESDNEREITNNVSNKKRKSTNNDENESKNYDQSLEDDQETVENEVEEKDEEDEEEEYELTEEQKKKAELYNPNNLKKNNSNNNNKNKDEEDENYDGFSFLLDPVSILKLLKQWQRMYTDIGIVTEDDRVRFYLGLNSNTQSTTVCLCTIHKDFFMSYKNKGTSAVEISLKSLHNIFNNLKNYLIRISYYPKNTVKYGNGIRINGFSENEKSSVITFFVQNNLMNTTDNSELIGEYDKESGINPTIVKKLYNEQFTSYFKQNDLEISDYKCYISTRRFEQEITAFGALETEFVQIYFKKKGKNGSKGSLNFKDDTNHTKLKITQNNLKNNNINNEMDIDDHDKKEENESKKKKEEINMDVKLEVEKDSTKNGVYFSYKTILSSVSSSSSICRGTSIYLIGKSDNKLIIKHATDNLTLYYCIPSRVISQTEKEKGKGKEKD